MMKGKGCLGIYQHPIDLDRWMALEMKINARLAMPTHKISKCPVDDELPLYIRVCVVSDESGQEIEITDIDRECV
jgi:hypothetical protein